MISVDTVSWSFSHYTLALQCLRKYKYVVIDKLVSEGPESSDLIFGSALHSAINACLTGQDGLATFELYWSLYQNKEVSYGRYDWKQLAELGAKFIKIFIKYHAKRYGLEFAEKRLFSEYKGLKFEGTLDYYGKYDGKPGLRDFKTSARNYEPAKRESALQLYLYAFLYLSNFPSARIDTLGYTVFNKGTGYIQDLTWEFEESKMYEALDNMASYCLNHQLEINASDKIFPVWPKNYGACLDYNRKCEFWDKCHGSKK